jgi:serine/threonine-protein kinase
MVRAVTLALTVEKTTPARDSHVDPVALDLSMRARHRYFQGVRGIGAAIGLFEQALEHAPDHPTILAGYAMAQIRRFTFEEAHEAGGEKGRQAAEKALAVAPRLGEARVALANWHLAVGDNLLAAREVRQTLKDAPGLADAHDLAAKMLLEAGAFEPGLSRARSAIALEPRLTGADWLIPRAYALRGEVKKAVESFPPIPEATGEPASYWLNRARMAFWTRDVAFAEEWFPKLRDDPKTPPGAIAMLGFIVKGFDPVMAIAAVEASASAPGKAMRRRQFFCQIRAEIFGYMGDTARSLLGLTDANKCELFDIAWVEGCPLLEAVRSDPAYGPIRDAVAARAKAVRKELLE